MSIAGILSSSLFSLNSQTVNSPQQSFQKEFQQLGKDLQSGNASAAQQDFANLQQDLQSQGAQGHHHHHHGGGAGSGQQTNIAQEFAQLGQDLQAGNVTAAQQAYSAVQQSFLTSSSSSAFTLPSAAASPAAAGLQVTA